MSALLPKCGSIVSSSFSVRGPCSLPVVIQSNDLGVADRSYIRLCDWKALRTDAHVLTDIEYEIEPAVEGVASVRYLHQ